MLPPMPPQRQWGTEAEISREADLPPHADWLCATSAKDAQDTLNAMVGRRWDWLVVDHYSLDALWEQRLRSVCLQIAVLDDLADRDHDCDLLIDPGLEPDLPARYALRLARRTEMFIGPQYAILRPEFDAARDLLLPSVCSTQRVLPRQLLVMFGGNDASGHTFEALEAIDATVLSGTKVDVIVSAINRDLFRLVDFCAANDNFSLHVASNKVGTLMARADFIIASGGGATWERLYLRKPSIVKIVASNQKGPLEYMASIGLLGLYGSREELETALRQAFAKGVAPPPDVVQNGVNEIIRALLCRLVTLQLPRPLDLRRSFHWLQDRSLRQQFLMHGDAPLRRGHFQYWRHLLLAPDKRVYSVYQGRHHIGTAGLRDIDYEHLQVELWLYIGERKKRGAGLGRAVLERLESIIYEQLGCRIAVVHVSRFNLPAYRLYSRTGYQLSAYQDSEELGFSKAVDVVRMEKNL